VFIAPEGSVAVEQEIIIYKYDAPSLDNSPYYTVTDEYEITGPDGGHIFFDMPVFFGFDTSDEEEALQSSIQIFDEYMGVWVKAETAYNQADGKLYLVTNHFSSFRKFVSDMYKGAKRVASQAGKTAVGYVYAAKDTTLSKPKITSAMEIKENGVGVFRYNFAPNYMFKDDTAITRSFWFEASPANMIGDAYRLAGLEMTDRILGEPPLEGDINKAGKSVKDVLVPYSAEAKVYINGPSDMVFELTREELPFKHDFKATACPVGEYRFNWNFKNGFAQDTNGKDESNVSTTYTEFKEYKPTVTLYDMKNNILSSYEVTLTLKEKESTTPTPAKEAPVAATPVPTPIPTPTPTPTPTPEAIVPVDFFECLYGTRMDLSFSGGTLTGEDWTRTKGFVGYSLKGTCKAGDAVSLTLTGTQSSVPDTNAQADLVFNNLSMTLEFLDSNQKVIGEKQKYNSGNVKDASLSHQLGVALPSGTATVKIGGTFTCRWSTPYTVAVEMVSVNVVLKVEE